VQAADQANIMATYTRPILTSRMPGRRHCGLFESLVSASTVPIPKGRCHHLSVVIRIEITGMACNGFSGRLFHFSRSNVRMTNQKLRSSHPRVLTFQRAHTATVKSIFLHARATGANACPKFHDADSVARASRSTP
jgi:hypothetical protein